MGPLPPPPPAQVTLGMRTAVRWRASKALYQQLLVSYQSANRLGSSDDALLYVARCRPRRGSVRRRSLSPHAPLTSVGAAGRGGDQARAPRHARAHREAALGGRRRRRGGALARRGGGARGEAVARVGRARAAQHDRRRGRALGAAPPRPHRAARVAGRAGPAGRRRDRRRVRRLAPMCACRWCLLARR